ncbi:MAG: alpha/beta hydrolase [Phenylobacterium sp.]|uniref:alpha/beta hydrolase n=1 Tax=Phenylobacterium sp. TaxID=1871053 RepID=UPI0025DE6590|nr:alpha/beta hydrolase [Phenylobacterium sp.]MCA3712236.1 alpha/beta hydrolase [Phenylobacterium sp.]MCA3724685.1 alpha/beta hydrolase [Phenylobacterium sp.]MCA6255767.1 alpha/beta hydrolase [Phenylobacterium sp.]
MSRSGQQRAILSWILSLPAPVLRLLSGGVATYREGRTLDPRLQFLAAGARRGRPMSAMTPEEARRASAAAFRATAEAPPSGVRIEALTVPGGEGDRPARLYRPSRPSPEVPVLVFAHMGGGVIGDLDTTEGFCGRLAETLRGPVLSVEYRLAPEHRFPAGYEDVLAAFRWARDNAGALGAPAGRAAIGGDSMGGLFAAALAQELKRAGEPGPELQLLVYPCVDLASETPSMTAFADAFPLDRATMDWFVGHYLPPGGDPADPRNAPGRTEDLSGLAPAVIATAGFDPLVDQGEAYARRLAAAGVPVDYRRYDSLVHGFTAFGGVVPEAHRACGEIAGLVAARLSQPLRKD